MKSRFWIRLIVVLAAFFSIVVIFPSGLHYCYESQCGVMFWGAHEHDSVWHLAVANTLFSNFPFEMPNMNGVTLTGYNYLLDLVVAVVSKVTTLSSSLIYFQIIPLLFVAIYIYTLLKFAKIYSRSKNYGFWLVLFSFFGSSLAFILSLKNRGSIWGSSGLLAMQPLQNLLNVQFALSLPLLLVIMMNLAENKRGQSDYVKYGIITFLILSLKFYTGFAAVLYLLCDYLILTWQKKKIDLRFSLKNMLVAIFALASILLFYKGVSSVGSPLIFRPLATVNPIIEDSSLFYLRTSAERLYTTHGIKLALLELGVIVLFVVMNYGSRVVAIATIAKSNSLSLSSVKQRVIGVSLAMFILSILFVQRGVWWNTVQFLYVSLFLTNILAAEAMDWLWNQGRRRGKAIAIILVMSMIPTNIDIIRSFTHFPGNSLIPKNEVEALGYLAKQDRGVVLADYLRPSRERASLATLNSVYDTSYVAAYSHQQTYLNDLIQLELTNKEYKSRLAKLRGRDCGVLEEVDYVYELNARPYFTEFVNCGRRGVVIFSNDLVTLYGVR